MKENKEEIKNPGRGAFDFVEMLALITVCIVLCFTFVVRLNIVDGPSMEDTLHTGEFLVVSDLFYDPTPGDIIVIHDMTVASSYQEPLVKRVIAVGGQTIDINFDSEPWVVTVDGKEIDESAYATFKPDAKLTSNRTYPYTLKDDEVFFMGDNRNHSADSRLREIGEHAGYISTKSVVGKVYARIFPFDKMTVFRNPYSE